jgi:hypothetical protein
MFTKFPALSTQITQAMIFFVRGKGNITAPRHSSMNAI